MSTEMIQQLAMVLNALNSTEVKGKQNMANLAGSIGILEDIIVSLQKPEEGAEGDV